MRLKYYILTLRQMSIKKSFVFFIVILAFIICFGIFYKLSVKPKIKALCQEKSKSIALKCINDATLINMEKVEYKDLIEIQKDSEGKIVTLTADTIEMNKISNKVSLDTIKEIESLNENYIKIPIISFLGADTFGGYGPNIKIKIIPTGSLKSQFISTFEEAGINQTKHSIYIRFTVTIQIITPFYQENEKYVHDILVAETVIIGNTPNSYYNITGVENIDKKDMLNLLD